MGTLKNILRKIEIFLRGESWLHFATMFFLMAVIAQFIHNKIILCMCIFGIAVGWEYFWYRKRKNEINITDIIFTILGGIVALGIYLVFN